jgi:hypothetical protein
MATLTETIALKGRTLETIADYAQRYVDEHWQQVFQQHLPALEEIRARVGDQAYARYGQELFRPLADEFKQVGLICDPALPGTFPLSREQWGAQEERERRFWCVLYLENGSSLGTLITRYFHDHTWLRIPRAPIVLACEQTNQTAIAIMVETSAIPGL